MKPRAALWPFVLMLAGAGLALPAQAVTLDFDCITNLNASSCAAGEAQLSVEVLEDDLGARFVFTNDGPVASSITDVYFDDGTLLGIAAIDNGPNVSFSQDASPPNLPGGNNASPPFEVTAGFSADSDAPVLANGVNPGESLAILFYLQGTGTFADVLEELADGRLRIGLHVQGFGGSGGGSESFVNLPTVPVPAAFWLLASGIGVLSTAARRRR